MGLFSNSATDTVTFGQSPQDAQSRTPEQIALAKQAAEALAFAQRYYGDVVGGRTMAQQQQQQGLAAAQQTMRGAAGARGMDPLAARAAAYGSGAIASRGVTELAILREQERAQAAAMVTAAGGQALGAQGGIMGDVSGRFGANIEADNAERDRQAGLDAAETARNMGYVSTAVTTAGAATGYSDIRMKQSAPPAGGGDDAIRKLYASPTSRALEGATPPRTEEDATIERMRGLSYYYRPEALKQGEPPGRQYGPMAQELQATPLLKGTVVDTPGGKRVDMARAGMASLGLVGRLGERQGEADERIRKLEAMLAGAEAPSWTRQPSAAPDTRYARGGSVEELYR